MSKDDKNAPVNMSGYLEKKGKAKMMSSWKTQWFVLKERLLLYYRSKDEYEALSPCKGTINLGPNCTVKPCSGTSCVFQIETRAKTILLKAKSRLEQEKWLQAILSALNQNTRTSTGMMHFRYSSDDLEQKPREETKQVLLSRQQSMPTRQKQNDRETKCSSFEYLKNRLESIDKERTRHSDNNSFPKVENGRESTSEVIDNDLYSVAKEPDDENLVNFRRKRIENEYERVTSNDDIIPINLIGTRYTKFENLYERIPSTSDETGDLNIHETDVILENDQYCSPAIKITETKQFDYHEYNIPQTDSDLYSIPNTDHNKNRVSSTNQHVNPYSICHIYPKEQETVTDEVLYDRPLFFEGSEDKCREATKLTRLSSSGSSTEEKKPTLPKKKNFLKNFFKMKNSKKTDGDNGDDLTNRKVLDKLQHLMQAKRPDSDKTGDDFANKRVLEELQHLLQTKRQNLEIIINSPEQSTSFMNMEEALYQEISEIMPHLQMAKNDYKPRNSITCKVEAKTLTTIDGILNDLDNMKRNRQEVTCRRVRELIDRFDNTNLENMNQSLDEEVTIREKNETIVDNTLYGVVDPRACGGKHTSSDELNRLLSELVKVTNAPLMAPGVTTSLSVKNCTDNEFRSLDKLKLRRHSDPDYDIPRPHSNLNIAKEVLKKDDSLVATRFFGPVLTGNEGTSHFTTPMVSMAPDSLEMQTSSYNSHTYANLVRRNIKTFNIEESKNDDVFIDSLEPFNIA